MQLFGDDYPGFLIAILPPGAFFTAGLLIAGRNWLGRPRWPAPGSNPPAVTDTPASKPDPQRHA
jgi:electron transport complex protein RnfE